MDNVNSFSFLCFCTLFQSIHLNLEVRHEFRLAE